MGFGTVTWAASSHIQDANDLENSKYLIIYYSCPPPPPPPLSLCLDIGVLIIAFVTDFVLYHILVICQSYNIEFG